MPERAYMTRAYMTRTYTPPKLSARAEAAFHAAPRSISMGYPNDDSPDARSYKATLPDADIQKPQPVSDQCPEKIREVPARGYVPQTRREAMSIQAAEDKAAKRPRPETVSSKIKALLADGPMTVDSLAEHFGWEYTAFRQRVYKSISQGGLILIGRYWLALASTPGDVVKAYGRRPAMPIGKDLRDMIGHLGGAWEYSEGIAARSGVPILKASNLLVELARRRVVQKSKDRRPKYRRAPGVLV